MLDVLRGVLERLLDLGDRDLDLDLEYRRGGDLDFLLDGVLVLDLLLTGDLVLDLDLELDNDLVLDLLLGDQGAFEVGLLA